MRLEFLLQFIVPLTFLAIWALTSLLNRDAQPLPPRPGAGRGPGGGPGRVGPGAGIGGGFSPSARAELARAATTARPSPSAAERATTATRWAPASGPGRPGAGSLPTRAVDDGIVIIESETRAARGSSTFSPSAAASGARAARGTGASARRTASRARSTSAAPIPPREPERRRSLTGLTGQPLGQKQGKALEIAPLATPIAPISSAPLTTSSQTPAAEVVRTAAPQDVPTLSIGDIRAMLASPRKIREVALLGELLQPPVSMRGPRRGR